MREIYLKYSEILLKSIENDENEEINDYKEMIQNHKSNKYILSFGNVLRLVFH